MLLFEFSSTSGGTCSGSACPASVLLARMLQGLSQGTAVPLLQVRVLVLSWCRMLQPRQSVAAPLALPHLLLAEPQV